MREIVKKKREQINHANGLMSPTKAVASGNKKLPACHIIFNMSSATNCPAAELGMCAVQKSCYAKAEELRWTTVRNCKTMVEGWFKSATKEQVLGLIEGYLKEYKREYPITHLRINESGDFTDQESIATMEYVASELLERHGIHTYGWSARKDLDFTVAPHIIINGSNVDVKGAQRLFLAVPQGKFDAMTTLKEHERKCSADCRDCHICSTNVSANGITKVYCRSHGSKAEK